MCHYWSPLTSTKDGPPPEDVPLPLPLPPIFPHTAITPEEESLLDTLCEEVSKIQMELCIGCHEQWSGLEVDVNELCVCSRKK